MKRGMKADRLDGETADGHDQDHLYARPGVSEQDGA
jgi:hypothetical protein